MTPKKRRRRVIQQDKINWEKPMNQEQFADLVGLTQQEVSKLIHYSVLPENASAREWNRYYIRFLQGQIFARKGYQGLKEIYG